MGPGLRTAVWVQGCPLRCPGCISPAWTEARANQLLTPDQLLVETLSDNPQIEGLTLSGGEPFTQAAGLAAYVRLAKDLRPNLTVLCFSGFRLESLQKMPGAGDLLNQLDTLIDSPYIRALDDNRGLRGSSNQRIHHLTDRMSAFDFENAPRQAEMYLDQQELVLVGVPPRGLLTALDQLSRGVS